MKDLQTFKKIFLSDKVRDKETRLEYHGQNLDRDLTRAKDIIDKHSLGLIARTTGDMAANRTFEVIQMTDNSLIYLQ
jgi:hypothetical protein